PNFPYQEQHFRIAGTTFSYQDDKNLRLEERLLEQRKENAEKIKRRVEEWLLTIPIRMQRIIKYKIFEGMTWEQTAANIGRKATENGLKKEFERFMKKR
ncbi:RNA polymerase subunit sigma-70, partial [Lachnospiraceae bacterium]|nr:RNA polymerase subunit sigma-70 [Lachnospiraceae bacterium]